MSLTSLLARKDVRAKFAETFRMPSVRKCSTRLLVPCLSKHYSLVGTAFDYLLRFELERINGRRCVVRDWVALFALLKVREYRLLFRSDALDWLYQTVGEIVFAAEKERLLFLRSGRLTTGVLRACLNLASVDPIQRSKSLSDFLGGYPEVKLRTLRIAQTPTSKLSREDKLSVKEMRMLIGAFRRESGRFGAKQGCALNPTFGMASSLVGGGDADILLDDVLIDIKTTPDPRLKRSYLNQLVGYYILNRIGGTDGLRRKPTMRHLGVYFSRYAELLTFPVREVVPRRGMPEFLTWFEKKARRCCR